MSTFYLIIISVICSLAVSDSRPGDKFRGDTVPFMLVVQHSSGPHCAGALVSMRSAVSTASCVSLSQGPITVMAGPYLTGLATIDEAVRRITSIVLPKGYVASADFAGAVNDVAVLRLEKPFGMSKLVRPILIEKEYAAYEKEGKLCNLVRALKAPVTRQRREEKNSKADTYESVNTQKTPISRNLDFTISYEWLNLNNTDIVETIDKDKLNSTFTKNVITQTTRDAGQNVANTSNIPNELDRSNRFEGEANSTIADSTIQFTAMNNETVRMKRDVIKTSTTSNLNVTKQNAGKDLVRNETTAYVKRAPTTTSSPTSGMTIFRIYDVRTLNMDQCREDNTLVGNSMWAAMREQVVCTHGVNFCQTDWGTGLVCNGKLCALLSRVAHPTGQPIDAGCGTTHTLQSLGRWKRFLGCAHDRGNCDELPCSKYCQENVLKLDEKYKLTTLHDDLGVQLTPSPYGKTKSISNHKSVQRQNVKDITASDSEYDDYIDSDESKQKSEDDSDASDNDSSDLSEDEQLNQQRNDRVSAKPAAKDEFSKLREQLPALKEQLPVLKEQLLSREPLPVMKEPLSIQKEHFTTETSTQKRTVNGFKPTRTPSQYTSPRSMTKELTHASSRDNEHNLVEYEPYRADFKGGEYGENAVDYRDSSEDDYVITGNSTNVLHINSTTHHPPSRVEIETSLATKEITSALLETTLMRDTSVYDLMPKLKYVDGENYKLARSDAAIIGNYPLLELVVVFTCYLLR